MRIAVAGATGYVGGEILRILSRRADIEIGALTAGSSAGSRLGEHHRHLPRLRDAKIQATDPSNLLDHDVVLMALPHGATADLVAGLDPEQVLIDCGADHRLRSADDWTAFYGGAHQEPWAYGLPEVAGNRNALTGARRIAVPGCYPTAATLALAPAIAAGAIQDDVVIVATSGASGAGRAPSPHLLGAEVMGSLGPYGVGGTHRHVPEIRQNLAEVRALAGQGEPVLASMRVSFTPQLAPMPRGLVAVCSAPMARDVTTSELRATYAAAYQGEPFVSVLDEGEWPSTGPVLASNAAHVQCTVDAAAGRIVAVCAIDNLGKGAAGAAVQCMNLALGIDEGAGLQVEGVAP